MGSTLFNLEVHYGGHFVHDPFLRYDGGQVAHINKVDPDFMSYFEMVNTVRDLGYHDHVMLIHFRLPNYDLEEGLGVIDSDQSILEMFKVHEENDSIQIFVEPIVLDPFGVQPPIQPPIVEPCTIKQPANMQQAYQNSSEGSDYNHEIEEEDDENECEISADDMEYFLDDDILTDGCDPIPDDGEPNINQLDAIVFARVDEEQYNEYLNSKGNGINMEENVQSDPEMIDIPNDSDDISSDQDFPEFNVEKEKEDPKLVRGMIFPSVGVFRAALRQYSLNEGFQLKFIKNESRRVTAKCDRNCGWRVHASNFRKTTAFQIKSLGGLPHRCGWSFRNRSGNSTWIAKTYLHQLSDNPKWDVNGFRLTVQRCKKLIISRRQAYRAKAKAKEIINGDIRKQYWRLRDYCQTLIDKNPGSAALVRVETPPMYHAPIFKRIFVMFGAQNKGFIHGCRPIIGLDACFLKGTFWGQLMSVVATDANNQMYPLAMAIVEAENKDSWSWFLEQLNNELGHAEVMGWVFISDRQKGLVQSFQENMPGVEHRFCVRHLYANFKLQFKDKELRDLMWGAARAFTFQQFNSKMNELRLKNMEAHRWLAGIPPEQWTKSRFSPKIKCDMLCNNICECFNQWVNEFRDQPILTMLESIRRNLMCRYQEKRDWIQKYKGPLCPKIQAKLDGKLEEVKNCDAMLAGESIWEVKDQLVSYVVNLNDRSCTCREFDVTGIPCVHALTAIVTERREPTNFVASCYTVETYKRAYRHMIVPIPDESQWVRTNYPPVMPPIVKKQPGRPKKQRKRGLDELKNPHAVSKKGSKGHCSRCQSTGHNTRTCKGPYVAKTSDHSNKGTKTKYPSTVGSSSSAMGCNSQVLSQGSTPRGKNRLSNRGRENRSKDNGQRSNNNRKGKGSGRGQNYGPSCGIGNWNGLGMSNFTPASVIFSDWEKGKGGISNSSVTSVIAGSSNAPSMQRQETRFGYVHFSSQRSSCGVHVHEDQGGPS